MQLLPIDAAFDIISGSISQVRICATGYSVNLELHRCNQFICVPILSVIHQDVKFVAEIQQVFSIYYVLSKTLQYCFLYYKLIMS